MHVTQLLALSGVTMAAGAMMSFSFALSPPLTLLPSRSVPVDIYRNVIPQKHQTVETVGAGSLTLLSADGRPPETRRYCQRQCQRPRVIRLKA
jgi:hypothetical protein